MSKTTDESIVRDISSLVKTMLSPGCSERYTLDLELDDKSRALVLYSNTTEGDLEVLNIIISREVKRDETTS